MSIEQLIRALGEEECQFAVPKRGESRKSLEETFGRVLRSTTQDWLIPCRHVFRAPASLAEIAQVERELGFPLPAELRQFLLIANGAELFSLHYHYTPTWQTWVPRYLIFSTSDLSARYHKEFRHFRTTVENDPNYQETGAFNYVPFCDVGDGNCLAIMRAEAKTGRIIFLDHEFAVSGAYYPYDDWTRNGYFTIANSLETWLGHLIQTRGRIASA